MKPFGVYSRCLAALIVLCVGTVERLAAQGQVGTRIKDIAVISGARPNQLTGLGLVTGIAGDGDKNPAYTLQMMANMFQRHGLTVPAASIASKNVAVVMVTAEIPAFIKNGAKLDVIVSSIGDAKTLQNGVLLQTLLFGADNQEYAMAQGQISVGGFVVGTEGGGGASVQKNHPTVGQIIGGAIVEREIPAEIVSDGAIEILLREPDFTSSSRMAAAVNGKFPASAQAIDSTTVRVKVPENALPLPVDFIARLESIELVPDQSARIVINERTGTIVATSRTRIAACAVSHGNLTINIASSLDVSQPAPFSQGGTTATTSRNDVQANESKAMLIPIPELPTVEKVASVLNTLGVTPRDMMSIFQAMKQAGALHAELMMR